MDFENKIESFKKNIDDIRSDIEQIQRKNVTTSSKFNEIFKIHPNEVEAEAKSHRELVLDTNKKSNSVNKDEDSKDCVDRYHPTNDLIKNKNKEHHYETIRNNSDLESQLRSNKPLKLDYLTPSSDIDDKPYKIREKSDEMMTEHEKYLSKKKELDNDKQIKSYEIDKNNSENQYNIKKKYEHEEKKLDNYKRDFEQKFEDQSIRENMMKKENERNYDYEVRRQEELKKENELKRHLRMKDYESRNFEKCEKEVDINKDREGNILDKHHLQNENTNDKKDRDSNPSNSDAFNKSRSVSIDTNALKSSYYFIHPSSKLGSTNQSLTSDQTLAQSKNSINTPVRSNKEIVNNLDSIANYNNMKDSNSSDMQTSYKFLQSVGSPTVVCNSKPHEFYSPRIRAEAHKEREKEKEFAHTRSMSKDYFYDDIYKQNTPKSIGIENRNNENRIPKPNYYGTEGRGYIKRPIKDITNSRNYLYTRNSSPMKDNNIENTEVEKDIHNDLKKDLTKDRDSKAKSSNYLSKYNCTNDYNDYEAKNYKGPIKEQEKPYNQYSHQYNNRSEDRYYNKEPNRGEKDIQESLEMDKELERMSEQQNNNREYKAIKPVDEKEEPVREVFVRSSRNNDYNSHISYDRNRNNKVRKSDDETNNELRSHIDNLNEVISELKSQNKNIRAELNEISRKQLEENSKHMKEISDLMSGKNYPGTLDKYYLEDKYNEPLRSNKHNHKNIEHEETERIIGEIKVMLGGIEYDNQIIPAIRAQLLLNRSRDEFFKKISKLRACLKNENTNSDTFTPIPELWKWIKSLLKINKKLENNHGHLEDSKYKQYCEKLMRKHRKGTFEDMMRENDDIIDKCYYR